jgi:hypothetical protein
MLALARKNRKRKIRMLISKPKRRPKNQRAMKTAGQTMNSSQQS